VDNMRNPDSALAVRNGFFIYHGWSDPYSARNCYYYSVGKRYSRAESRLESLWIRMDGRWNVYVSGARRTGCGRCRGQEFVQETVIQL